MVDGSLKIFTDANRINKITDDINIDSNTIEPNNVFCIKKSPSFFFSERFTGTPTILMQYLCRLAKHYRSLLDPIYCIYDNLDPLNAKPAKYDYRKVFNGNYSV